jgi:hypothetical protein
MNEFYLGPGPCQDGSKTPLAIFYNFVKLIGRTQELEASYDPNPLVVLAGPAFLSVAGPA